MIKKLIITLIFSIGIVVSVIAQKTVILGGDLATAYSRIMSNTNNTEDAGGPNPSNIYTPYTQIDGGEPLEMTNNVLLGTDGRYQDYQLTQDIIVNNMNEPNLTSKNKLTRAMNGNTIGSRMYEKVDGYQPNKFMKFIPTQGDALSSNMINNNTNNKQNVNSMLQKYGSPKGGVANMALNYSQNVYQSRDNSREIKGSSGLSQDVTLDRKYNVYSSPNQAMPGNSIYSNNYIEPPKPNDNDSSMNESKSKGLPEEVTNEIQQSRGQINRYTSDLAKQGDLTRTKMRNLIRAMRKAKTPEERIMISEAITQAKDEYKSNTDGAINQLTQIGSNLQTIEVDYFTNK